MIDDTGDQGRLTDEEIAERRRARFGELPARATRDDLVETTDAEPAHEELPAPQVRREWG